MLVGARRARHVRKLAGRREKVEGEPIDSWRLLSMTLISYGRRLGELVHEKVINP